MRFKFDSVPEEQRCYQSDTGRFQNFASGDCFFGARPDASYGMLPLTEIPQDARGFHFYLGGRQQALFDSFLASELPKRAERLLLGNSSDDLGSGRDYSRLTAALARTEFPELEFLALGVWQLFCNSHCLYGRLGAIDALADVMPRLKRLELYGNFTLQSPLRFPELEVLTLIVDDEVTGVNGGAVGPGTLSNLLSSDLPNLRDLYIDVRIGNGSPRYAIPGSMFASDVFPELTRLELAGNFRDGDKERLLDAPILNHVGQKVSLDEMRHAPDAAGKSE